MISIAFSEVFFVVLYLPDELTTWRKGCMSRAGLFSSSYISCLLKEVSNVLLTCMRGKRDFSRGVYLGFDFTLKTPTVSYYQTTPNSEERSKKDSMVSTYLPSTVNREKLGSKSFFTMLKLGNDLPVVALMEMLALGTTSSVCQCPTGLANAKVLALCGAGGCFITSGKP